MKAKNNDFCSVEIGQTTTFKFNI